MTPEQWKQLDELFDEANSLAPSEWATFASRRCEGDEVLRSELMSLLQAQSRGGGLLEVPIASVSGLVDGPGPGSHDVMIGAKLGAFTIEGVLGRGGMGVVYRARQDSPRREVALKVVHPGTLGGSSLRRFAREAEMLGRLQHPGVAQIYESGQAKTPLGLQPYFAMELVEGRPLLEYAKEAALSIRARLEVFARICDAVQFAHLKGIIHRDLKPGNILVNERGEPKVLDFGIARLTNSDTRAVTMQTDIGQLVGTIPYMSPEQAAGDPRELDTRSDVYALGVVLFELLSGRLPYEVKERPVTEAVRIVSEKEPTRLGSISREFRGDIDTIVGRALEKDRNRRYQTAAELGADVRRFLADQAIVARPASSIYQFRKFARRNKALVGGVVCAMILLLAGTVGTSIGMARALHSEAVAKSETTKARTEASKAKHAVAFLQDMLAAANPEVAQGRDLTVHDTLNEAAARVETELRDEPAVRAAVQETLGRAYLATGDLERARERLAKSIEDYRAVGGEVSDDIARGLGHLAALKAAEGNRKGALEYAAASLKMYESLKDEMEIASARVDVGMYHYQLNQYPEAERHLKEAIGTFERLVGRRARETANALDILGQVHIAKSEFDAGVAALRESADIKRSVVGESSPALAFSLNNLAAALQNQGRPAEAEPYIRECVEIRRRVYGHEHSSVAAALVTLGLVSMELDRFGDAEKSLLESLAVRRRVLPAGHIEIAHTLQALGKLCTRLRRADEAIVYLQEALDIRRARLGEHRLTAQTLEDLGSALLASGDAAKAEGLAREALDMRRKLLGPTSPMVARTLAILASSRAEQGEYADAERCYAECMAILDARNIAPTHPTRLSFSVEHAAVLHKLGRDDEARPMFVAAIETLRGAESRGSTDLARTLDRFADLLADTGDARGAERALTEVVGVYTGVFGQDHAITQKAQSRLLRVRDSSGEGSKGNGRGAEPQGAATPGGRL